MQVLCRACYLNFRYFAGEGITRPARARRAPVSYVEIKDSSEEESDNNDDSGSVFDSEDITSD